MFGKIVIILGVLIRHSRLILLAAALFYFFGGFGSGSAPLEEVIARQDHLMPNGTPVDMLDPRNQAQDMAEQIAGQADHLGRIMAIREGQRLSDAVETEVWQDRLNALQTLQAQETFESDVEPTGVRVNRGLSGGQGNLIERRQWGG